MTSYQTLEYPLSDTMINIDSLSTEFKALFAILSVFVTTLLMLSAVSSLKTSTSETNKDVSLIIEHLNRLDSESKNKQTQLGCDLIEVQHNEHDHYLQTENIRTLVSELTEEVSRCLDFESRIYKLEEQIDTRFSEIKEEFESRISEVAYTVDLRLTQMNEKIQAIDEILKRRNPPPPPPPVVAIADPVVPTQAST